MISIVDYGLGNVRAFVNVYDKLNIPVTTVSTSEELEKASKIILPGVGSFDDAMSRLEESGMMGPLEEMVQGKGVPVLGVCVGMQMLARSSEEGVRPGLGWIDGEVKRFQPGQAGRPLRVPHMGWNTVGASESGGLFEGLDGGSRFYFLHSYYFHCHDANSVIATTDYEGKFASAVRSKNIFGVQFHPEKSHHWGTRLLENYARLI